MAKKRPSDSPPVDAGPHALDLATLAAPPVEADASVTEPPADPEAAEEPAPTFHETRTGEPNSLPGAVEPVVTATAAESDGNDGTSGIHDSHSSHASHEPPEPVVTATETAPEPAPEIANRQSPIANNVRPCLKIELRRPYGKLPPGTPLALVELNPDVPGLSLNRLVDLVRHGFATDAPAS